MEQTNYQYELSFHEVFKKDSLEITEEDREKLKNYITRLSEKTIIITHGSDTLLETSEVLSRIPNKTILLTAAMLPEKFKDSDAHFNLGMAFGGAQILKPGVYLAIHGYLANWNQFERDLGNGQYSLN
jgi:L-asparaginase